MEFTNNCTRLDIKSIACTFSSVLVYDTFPRSIPTLFFRRFEKGLDFEDEPYFSGLSSMFKNFQHTQQHKPHNLLQNNAFQIFYSSWVYTSSSKKHVLFYIFYFSKYYFIFQRITCIKLGSPQTF